MSVMFNVIHHIVMSVTLLHKLMKKILNIGWTNNLSFTNNATKMKLYNHETMLLDLFICIFSPIHPYFTGKWIKDL